MKKWVQRGKAKLIKVQKTLENRRQAFATAYINELNVLKEQFTLEVIKRSSTETLAMLNE